MSCRLRRHPLGVQVSISEDAKTLQAQTPCKCQSVCVAGHCRYTEACAICKDGLCHYSTQPFGPAFGHWGPCPEDDASKPEADADGSKSVSDDDKTNSTVGEVDSEIGANATEMAIEQEINDISVKAADNAARSEMCEAPSSS
jgi:hypothetical protein